MAHRSASPVHVVSYNVRYFSRHVGPGHPDYWPERSPLAQQFLRTVQPTLVGCQEVLFSQLGTLKEALGPDYDHVGYGREGGSQGEYNPLFFHSSLRLKEWDQLWLSDTPRQVGSKAPGAGCPRVMVVARFELPAHYGSDDLWVINTHLDHQSDAARMEGATIIRDLITEMALDRVIVTGDFNAAARRSAPYDLLTGGTGLVDTYAASGNPETGSFLDYGPAQPDGERIDWILTSPGLKVQEAGLDAFTVDGRQISDHAQAHALLRV